MKSRLLYRTLFFQSFHEMLTLWVIKEYTIAATFLFVWTTTQDKVAV